MPPKASNIISHKTLKCKQNFEKTEKNAYSVTIIALHALFCFFRVSFIVSQSETLH